MTATMGANRDHEPMEAGASRLARRAVWGVAVWIAASCVAACQRQDVPPPPSIEPGASVSARATDAPPEAARQEVFQEQVTEQVSAGGPVIGGGYVYWTHEADVGRQGLGKDRVQRKPLAGGPVEDVAGPDRMFDVDVDAERVFWQADAALWSRPHAGGAPTKLAELPPLAIRFAVGDKHVLAYGDTAALVPKTGGAAQAVAGLPSTRSATVVADGDRFFVLTVARGEKPGIQVGTIYVCGPSEPARVLVADVRNPSRLIGVDGDHLYFSADGRLSVSPRLWRTHKTQGGTPEPVGDAAWGFHRGRLVAGTYYGSMWVDRWAIFKWPLAGGAPVQIGEFKNGMPDGFDVDGEHVYWIFLRNLYRARR